MTNKQKIIDFMRGKESVKVKDIQTGLPEIKPTVIWGVIAGDHYKNFERVSRGIYRLKIAEITPQIAQN